MDTFPVASELSLPPPSYFGDVDVLLKCSPNAVAMPGCALLEDCVDMFEIFHLLIKHGFLAKNPDSEWPSIQVIGKSFDPEIRQWTIKTRVEYIPLSAWRILLCLFAQTYYANNGLEFVGIRSSNGIAAGAESLLTEHVDPPHLTQIDVEDLSTLEDDVFKYQDLSIEFIFSNSEVDLEFFYDALNVWGNALIFGGLNNSYTEDVDSLGNLGELISIDDVTFHYRVIDFSYPNTSLAPLLWFSLKYNSLYAQISKILEINFISDNS